MKILYQYKLLTLLFVFFLFGFLLYANTFDNQLFWDDDDLITNNVYIQDLENNWQNFFTENLIAGAGQTANYWRPMLLFSFARDYSFWKLDPFGYHAKNMVIHIFAAWLVLLFLLKITGKKWIISFLAAFVFLIHPLQTEAVTYVAGRADPFSSVFLLLSLIFYYDFRSQSGLSQAKNIISRFFADNWRYLAALLFFVCGLLIKEQIVFLPLLLVLIDLVLFERGKLTSRKEYWLEKIKALIPFFIISLIYGIVRITLLNFNDILGGTDYASLYDASLSIRLLTFTKVMAEYFKLLFYPVNLHMAREVAPVTSIIGYYPAIFFSGLVIMLLASFWAWKKNNRLVAFGFLWFLIILLPRTNIIAINRPMYEHWLYLPMVGFFLAIFSLIGILFKKIKRKSDLLALYSVYVMCFVLTIWFGFLSYQTVVRNNDWQDAITFYEKNLSYTPNSFIQHNNLAMAYSEAGREEEAILEYQRAIEINQNYPQVYYNLANSLASQGDWEGADTNYREAIKISPTWSTPYSNLFIIYLQNNEIEKAKELAFEAGKNLEQNEYNADLCAKMFYSVGEYQDALLFWQIAFGKDEAQLYLFNYLNNDFTVMKKQGKDEEIQKIIDKVSGIVEDKAWLRRVENSLEYEQDESISDL